MPSSTACLLSTNLPVASNTDATAGPGAGSEYRTRMSRPETGFGYTVFEKYYTEDESAKALAETCNLFSDGSSKLAPIAPGLPVHLRARLTGVLRGDLLRIEIVDVDSKPALPKIRLTLRRVEQGRVGESAVESLPKSGVTPER